MVVGIALCYALNIQTFRGQAGERSSAARRVSSSYLHQAVSWLRPRLVPQFARSCFQASQTARIYACLPK